MGLCVSQAQNNFAENLVNEEKVQFDQILMLRNLWNRSRSISFWWKNFDNLLDGFTSMPKTVAKLAIL